jgi:hypothetical protein
MVSGSFRGTGRFFVPNLVPTSRATITPELLPNLPPNDSDRPGGRSQINDIAGAGLKHLPPTVLRVEERWDLDAEAPVERAVDELATHTPCLRIGQIQRIAEVRKLP